MTPPAGSIGLAGENGEVMIRFQGDVRLSLCTTLDDLIERLFADCQPTHFVLDLGPATNVDSTCLGLIAKLGIESERRLSRQPQLYCTNADVQSQLDSLGLMPLFEPCAAAPDAIDVPVSLSPCAPVDAQPVVLEAHRILMDLQPSNQGRFQDLVRALDRD